MKANEFVKKHGWDYAKHILTDYAPLVMDLNYNDLKRLVESHELIDGDLEYAKKFYEDCAFKRDKHLIRYKQAIADVESCQ